MTTRFRDGDVTVTLDGGLDEFVRSALSAAQTETVRLLEGAAEEVRGSAEPAWYGPEGVTRRTGRSGEIGVVTTFSRSEVRVSVGSTDIDKAKYVHRPGKLSTSVEEVDKNTYEAGKNRTPELFFHARRDQPGITKGKFYKVVSNPKAADGRYILPILVRKPMEAKIKALAAELGDAIARKAGG